jgi:hypothetical protein
MRTTSISNETMSPLMNAKNIRNSNWWDPDGKCEPVIDSIGIREPIFHLIRTHEH